MHPSVLFTTTLILGLGCLLLLASTEAASANNRSMAIRSGHRQSPPVVPAPPPAASSTSLALSTGPTASQILLPAMQALVGGPLRLLRQLASELVTFLRAHRPAQLSDLRFWQSVAVQLPSRASTYWHALVSMESQCAQRTVCDLAELASRRLPKWAQQGVLFYLNAFSETNDYYRVAISGLTMKRCATDFADCDVERFFGRLQGNVTEAIKATMAPVGAALADLVDVTSTTMRSMVSVEENGE